MIFRRIEPKRPVVIRKGNKVHTCYLYQNMKQCLGPQCFWPRVGTCAVYTRLRRKARAK